MVIEHASFRAVAKPWGRTDLRPWNRDDHGGAKIGEIWFGRAGSEADSSQLLLKLLFTSEPLSIQVHPDEMQAQAAGEPHGKTEAWYILAADADARVALGPKRSVTAVELREAVEAGQIDEMVQWRPAVARDVFVVPAGTIHAIGPGLAIVEIQQRSDTTYRLFDHGRHRGLQVDAAIAVACLSPAAPTTGAIPMGNGRSVIAVTPFFVLEHLDLAGGSSLHIETKRETWVLALDGEIQIAGISAGVGEAIFFENERSVLVVGVDDAVLLIAYANDRPEPDLLRPLSVAPGSPDDLPAAVPGTPRRRPPAALASAVARSRG